MRVSADTSYRKVGKGFLQGAAFLAGVLLLGGCARTVDVPWRPASESLPEFGKMENSSEKKARFLNYLGPIVESENERVLQQRERLLLLHGKYRRGQIPSWSERRWLEKLCEEYEVDKLLKGESNVWEALLRRVDIVPVRLALVQAAKESGWGTSRFAREGNNLFGQRCFGAGCGIVPDGRPAGEIYEVAAFDSVRDSVRSYIGNLNTHYAYGSFRDLRHHQRQRRQVPDGYTLAAGLPMYSERGEEYLDEVRAMIRANRSFFGS